MLPDILAKMPDITRERIQQPGLSNAALNPKGGRSIASLVVKERVIVIAAGPSIKRLNPARHLKDFDGTIICTDSAIQYCLRNGLNPHIVVSVDPHDRIATWFGAAPTDDYFQRQDMDEDFGCVQLAGFARPVALALASSASPKVVERVGGFDIHWWNPMYDGGEIDRALRKTNGYPSMNAGGNVGTACWMLAQILGAKDVALCGMDFGYYAGTPHERTQYFTELKELFGDEYHRLYHQVYNPFVDDFFYTDPAYLWYRDCFLALAADADCKTTNCTGGGILFGGNIEWKGLEQWLKSC